MQYVKYQQGDVILRKVSEEEFNKEGRIKYKTDTHENRAVCKKTGEYSTQEASVVSKLYNSELTRMKLQVEIHKINNKSSKTSTNEVLSLN